MAHYLAGLPLSPEGILIGLAQEHR